MRKLALAIPPADVFHSGHLFYGQMMTGVPVPPRKTTEKKIDEQQRRATRDYRETIAKSDTPDESAKQPGK
jgi:hypothetical protein